MMPDKRIEHLNRLVRDKLALLTAAKQALDVFIRCDCEQPHEGEQATDEEWNAAVDALRAAIAMAEGK